MFVELTPLDTLFCRDSRQFGVGDAHWADSLFPPPPSVCFGARRSAIYRLRGEAVAKTPWFGSGDTAGHLYQRGPAVLVKGAAYFPAPADAIVQEVGGSLLLTAMKPDPSHRETACSSVPLPYLLVPAGEPERMGKPAGETWISREYLQRYLRLDTGTPLEIPADHWRKRLDLFDLERRTNVAIEPRTHAAAYGQLFALGHVRLRPGVSLLCEWGQAGSIPAGAADLPSGLLQLGGEKRVARLATGLSGKYWPDPPPRLWEDTKAKTFTFRIYFATPAYFQDGSAGVPAMPATGTAAKLLAAAVGKPLALGGYDMVKKAERPIRRFIPAGSVYYCSAARAELDRVLGLHAHCLGSDAFLCAQGFGLAFLGSAPQLQDQPGSQRD